MTFQAFLLNVGEVIGLIQFQSKPKLGGNKLISTFQNRIESDIEMKLNSFKEENKRKHKYFTVCLT